MKTNFDISVYRYIGISMMALFSTSVFAQQDSALNRSVTVERDFQPVMPLMGGAMSLYSYCMEGEKPKTNPYYLDDAMMDRFAEFLDICEEYNIKVIVGLITGWMSGRMFVPPVLYQSNIINQ